MIVGFTTTYEISVYHHKCCEFEFHSWRGVLDTTLCDKVCQWLATGRWFSPGTPVFSTNKTDCQEITDILLNVVKHPNSNPNAYQYYFYHQQNEPITSTHRTQWKEKTGDVLDWDSHINMTGLNRVKLFYGKWRKQLAFYTTCHFQMIEIQHFLHGNTMIYG